MPATKNNGIDQITKTQIAVMANDLQYIKSEIHDLKDLQQNSYVTKERFLPIEKIVYGLVVLILIAVVGALINLVIRGKGS